MSKNDPKECGNCQEESCDPCPEMEPGDGAVLALLERLVMATYERGGSVDIKFLNGQYIARLTAYDYVTGRPQPFLSNRAPTLYQALLLAEEALGENEAAEMVECPACHEGAIYPGATIGMWAGHVPWNNNIKPETCALCNGNGEVLESVAEEWDAEQAALYDEL